MDRVMVEPGLEGLAEMLAELIRANLRDDPARARLLGEKPGTVRLRVFDVDVDLSIDIGEGRVSIGHPDGDADLTLETDSETLLELTNVPLRFGMPDTLTAPGRRVAGKLFGGSIKVDGLPRNLPLMIRLQRLFTVAR